MASRKKEQVYCQDTPVSVEEKTGVETKQKKCKVFNIVENNLFLYFDNYGLQVDVADGNTFKIGDVVPISYTGEIGTTNFKKWIVD